MSVRVRLTRVGSRKNPIWRVVVADQRSPRDGRFIEMIGHYNPQTEPSTIAIDEERLRHWIGLGAQPTSTVKQLMKAQSRGGGAKAVAEPAAAPASGPEPSEPEGADTGAEGTGSGPAEASESASAEATAAEGESPRSTEGESSESAAKPSESAPAEASDSDS